MILTRLSLNPFHARTYALIGDPYLLHKRLCTCFGGSRQESGVLYRIEEGPILIVQSAREADWSLLEEPGQVFKAAPETKQFDPSFREGQRLNFRLRCRPTKKSKVEGSKNSRFRYLRTDEDRFDWLARQGGKFGFGIESVLASEERWQDTKPTVLAGPTQPAPVSAGSRQSGSLPATRFDGVLVVVDPSKLRDGVVCGIGPQKAYGFGLLSLGRAQ